MNRWHNISFLACLAACWLSAAVTAQPSSRLDRLVGVEQRIFSRIVRSNVSVGERISDESIRAETFVYPQVALGRRHCLVFVEETRADRFTRNRPERTLPGMRIVELCFGDGDSVSTRELFKRTGEGAAARGLGRRPTAERLRLNYLDHSLPLAGRDLVVEYSPVDGRFALGSGESDRESSPAGIWSVTRRGDGELHVESTRGSVARTYRIRAGENDRFEVSGSVVAAIGSEWSRRFEHAVELPVSTEAERALLGAALRADAASGPRVSSAGEMLFVEFSLPLDTRGSEVLDLHEVAGLAIDMENLELGFLARLIDGLKDRTRTLDKETANGVGDERALQRFAELDADLTLARLFASLRAEGLKDRGIVDGIVDTQAEVANLVFQFPYELDGKTYAVAYSPGNEALFLTAGAPRWRTDGRPLQFKAPDGELFFAMRLKESDPIRLTGEKEKVLRTKLAASFGLAGLARAAVLTRLPPGRLAIELGEDGSGARQIRSLRERSAGIDRGGRMILNLSAAEGQDSFRLIDLYLRGNGLPLGIDVRRALTPARVPADGNGKFAPVWVGYAIGSDQDFDVVTEGRKTVSVTVMVPDQVFARSGRDVVTVRLCYADERVDRYRVDVARDRGEADVEMAVRMSGGKVEAGLRYSLDGEEWKLSRDGLYGFLFVDD